MCSLFLFCFVLLCFIRNPYISLYPLYIKGFSGTSRITEDHEKTRMEKTVNLLAYAYAGSNPALPTIFIINELHAKQGASG